MFINRYRFVELKYRRSEQYKKDGGSEIKPARIENVVIFLPDVHSCMPNRSEWEGVQQQYKQALEKLLSADSEEPVVVPDEPVTKTTVAEVPPSTTEEESAVEVPEVETNDQGNDDDTKMTDSTAADRPENEIPIVNLATHKPKKKPASIDKNHKFPIMVFFFCCLNHIITSLLYLV